MCAMTKKQGHSKLAVANDALIFEYIIIITFPCIWDIWISTLLLSDLFEIKLWAYV